MITVTIQELEQDPTSLWEYLFYAIRDMNFLFYVGRSLGPGYRLQNHITRQTPVGCYIKANRPESNLWEVDLYRSNDLKALMPEFMDIDFEQRREWQREYAVGMGIEDYIDYETVASLDWYKAHADILEKEFISFLKPALNIEGVRYIRSIIPNKYKRPKNKACLEQLSYWGLL